MLFNRVLERLRAQRASLRLLREEGRARRSRTPVLLVPSFLGVRLADTHGRVFWGDVPGLLRGAPMSGPRAHSRPTAGLRRRARPLVA